MNKNITLIIDGFKQGGGQQVYLLIIDQYIKKFESVNLIILESNKLDIELPKYPNLFITYLDSGKLIDLKNILVLKKILKTISPDIILSSFYRSQIWSALVKPKASRIIWIEQNTYYFRTWIQWLVMRILAKVAVEKIICVSAKVFDLTKEKIGGNIYFIPNPINFPGFDNVNFRKANDFVFIARMIPQKNPVLMLVAFKEFLNKNFLASKLHIIGDGELMQPIKNLSKELGIDDRCVFHGMTTIGETLNILSRSKTLVSVSLYEGFGLARLEALASGCCVVSTDTGGARDFLALEQNFGVFLTDYSVSSIANLMKISLEDKYWTTEKITKRIKSVAKYNSKEISESWIS